MEIRLEPLQQAQTQLATQMIQQAMDLCSQDGGGTLFFSKGVYLTGTIFWKSNVRIFVEYGAEIRGSTNAADYPRNVYKQMYKNEATKDTCLFFAQNCENIQLEGDGVINGQGAQLHETRPLLFRYLHCDGIRIRNIKLRAPSSWTNAFIDCHNIWVQGVDIFSRANHNGDGIDFDACSNVFVSDCKFDCSDDCICLQNSFADKVCENIVVTNCIMKSRWAGMRVGLLSCSTIKNLTVSNCIFREIDCSALKIQSAEGAVLENMTFSNLVMENVVRPIFVTANRFREHVGWPEEIKTPSVLQNIVFQNIISKTIDDEFLQGKETEPNCITIDCDPDNLIDGITLSHVSMQVRAARYQAREIPHHEKIRAEGKNYLGQLPACGLYARNVQHLKINDFEVVVLGTDTREKIVIV